MPNASGQDPDKIKGVINLVLGVILLIATVFGLLVGQWGVAIITLVFGGLDLYVSYLYFKRGGHIGHRQAADDAS